MPILGMALLAIRVILARVLTIMRTAASHLNKSARGKAVMALLGGAFLLGGCAHAPLNEPLKAYDQTGGFRYKPRPPDGPTSDLAIVLFFSGGGKRAAALSYGVLRELAATQVPAGTENCRMLDEVEIISSVSGGSFTAAYYALNHDRIFEDYEKRFLRKNIDRALVGRLFLPTNWPALSSAFYARSDMAAAYYDRHLFDGATFGDLVKRGGRPFVMINATDMANGEQFTFVQSRFDLIGSDLGTFPLARAVAASSAAPLLLTPITVKNHAGAAGEVQSTFLPSQGFEGELSERQRELHQLVGSYADARARPYLHLVDGGLSDNLGMRGVMDASLLQGGVGELMARIGMAPPRKLAIVIVNAATKRGSDWSQREAIPGTVQSIEQVGDAIGARANRRTLELFTGMLGEWRRKARADAMALLGPDDSIPAGAEPDYYLVNVRFEGLTDAEDRMFFQNLPTSFHLPNATVDQLIGAGGRLLREDDEFKRLLRDLAVDSRPEQR